MSHLVQILLFRDYYFGFSIVVANVSIVEGHLIIHFVVSVLCWANLLY